MEIRSFSESFPVRATEGEVTALSASVVKVLFFALSDNNSKLGELRIANLHYTGHTTLAGPRSSLSLCQEERDAGIGDTGFSSYSPNLAG